VNATYSPTVYLWDRHKNFKRGKTGLPSGYTIAGRVQRGYRSVTEFVAEAVRKRAEEIERAYKPISQLEEKIPNFVTNKKRKLKPHIYIFTLHLLYLKEE